MKTIITSLFCSYLLPVLCMAQPSVSNNEFYNIGDVIQMVKCDTAGIDAGVSGADVTWNFSALAASGGYAVTTVETDTSAVFLTANIMEVLPGGQQEYVQENGTASLVNGVYDPATGLTATYNNFDIAQRPVTYNTNYVDSYKVTIPGTPYTIGAGVMVETGDAYGTLTLPSGTYDNVLRIKKNAERNRYSRSNFSLCSSQ